MSDKVWTTEELDKMSPGVYGFERLRATAAALERVKKELELTEALYALVVKERDYERLVNARLRETLAKFDQPVRSAISMLERDGVPVRDEVAAELRAALEGIK
jgi:DNA polymerase I-like protein with 3'-5' exonuclease and polymerase domains